MSNSTLLRCSTGQTTELRGRALDQKDASANTDREIEVMAMKVRKGLVFPMAALPGVRHMPAKGDDEQVAARVFYVAATRATQRLRDWGWVEKLRPTPTKLHSAKF